MAALLATLGRWFLLTDQPLKSDFRPNHCRRCGKTITARRVS